MAGRRGVWLVVIFITIAVGVSAAGLVFTALLMWRQPSVASNSTLLLRVGGAGLPLDLVEQRTLDGHTQELIYRPTLH